MNDKQETVVETTEQRKLRLAKARLNNEAEEAAIVAEEKAKRDAAVKAETDRLESRGVELKADVDAKCDRIAKAMPPLVAAWNAAIDAGAEAVMYRVFGYADPSSGKRAHLAAGHSIQGVSRRLTPADVGYIPEAIQELRAVVFAEIEESVRQAQYDAAHS